DAIASSRAALDLDPQFVSQTLIRGFGAVDPPWPRPLRGTPVKADRSRRDRDVSRNCRIAIHFKRAVLLDGQSRLLRLVVLLRSRGNEYREPIGILSQFGSHLHAGRSRGRHDRPADQSYIRTSGKIYRERLVRVSRISRDLSQKDRPETLRVIGWRARWIDRQ